MAPEKRRAPPGWSGAPSRDVEFAGYDFSRVTHPTYQSQAHPHANAVDRKRHLIPIGPIAARIVQRLALAREVRNAS